jgi:hypothetical protein
MPDNETIKTCNKENGSFSQLWGRDCWVADSVLKLVEAAFDPGEYHNQSEGAREVCQAVEKYCKELRQLISNLDKLPDFREAFVGGNRDAAQSIRPTDRNGYLPRHKGEATMKPDNETINRHIHEKVMGHPCWHEHKRHTPGGLSTGFCVKCGASLMEVDEENTLLHWNPDYCSKKSPRELLEEAVDKAVEMVGAERLELILCSDLFRYPRPMRSEHSTALLTASAQQIATAIYHATKEEGK